MINQTDLENRILSLISVHNGLKGQELVLKLIGQDLEIDQNSILDMIFDMIHRGDLIEIEMVFPNHVSKSFLVPKNTSVNVIRRK